MVPFSTKQLVSVITLVYKRGAARDSEQAVTAVEMRVCEKCETRLQHNDNPKLHGVFTSNHHFRTSFPPTFKTLLFLSKLLYEPFAKSRAFV